MGKGKIVCTQLISDTDKKVSKLGAGLVIEQLQKEGHEVEVQFSSNGHDRTAYYNFCVIARESDMSNANKQQF